MIEQAILKMGTLCYGCKTLHKTKTGWYCAFFDTVPHDIHTTRMCTGFVKVHLWIRPFRWLRKFRKGFKQIRGVHNVASR